MGTKVVTDGAEPLARASGVVAIAASAGGVKALGTVLGGISPGLRAAVVVVQHLAPHHPSLLVQILGRHTGLTVREAHNGERIVDGTAYIAPPDHHVLLDRNGTVSLTDTARVHYTRPSADTLFESVAASFGDRALAVILTGAGSDGAEGARAVKRHGGRVIAQDEATSEYFGMPGAAIETGDVDAVLPLEQIASALTAWAGTGDRK